MIERIIAAVTFRSGVYKEVEHDESFTSSAWIIVAVAAVLNSFGNNAQLMRVSFVSWFTGSILRAVFSVGAFALSCFVIDWLSKALFNADTSFDELVRTLGLAYVWNAIGFLAIVSAISPALRCGTGLFEFAGGIAGLVAWVIAAKEALDLEWGETILTIVVGWVVQSVIVWIAGLILSRFGLGVVRSLL